MSWHRSCVCPCAQAALRNAQQLYAAGNSSARAHAGGGADGAAAAAAVAAAAAAAAETEARLRGRMRELEGALKQAMRDYKSLVAELSAARGAKLAGRGLHSSTSQLNLSRV
jgi:hypothetical protein